MRVGGRLVRQALTALAIVLGSLGSTSPGGPSSEPAARVLDAFDDVTPWAPVKSEGVQASVRRVEGPGGGGALRLDFDLAGTAGYALARRALPLELPANYEIIFYLRGDAPANQFQVKLADASGDNVWWVNRPDFELPREWRLVRIKKRQIEFAWGPTADRVLRRAASIEIGVAAGRGGGHGSVEVSGLALRELPAQTVTPPPIARASSWMPGGEPSRALDGSLATAWTSNPAAGPAQTLTVDFQSPREFGGLVVRWLAGTAATDYDVQFSDDGVAWRTVRTVAGGRGGPDAVWLPEAETRFLRLTLRAGPANTYRLAELEIRDLAFGASANAFFQALAREAPRGTYPRGMSGELPAWTLVGVDGGEDSALLSEDGALEVARAGFSIEPFVVADSRVVGWADVKPRQTLLDDYLPMPAVTWTRPEWELRVSAFGAGARGRSRVVARYDLRNLTDRPLSLELVLAVRPFQVNPPAQFLTTPGGVTSVRDVGWDGATLSVNTDRRIFPLRTPDRVGAFPFDAGPVPALLGAPDWSGQAAIHDELGFASAALGYRLSLAPAARATVAVVVPLSAPIERPVLGTESVTAWLDREQSAVATAWRERLNRVSLDLPASGRVLADTFRTALAHVLITRDGPRLRPGTRSYARSWIRDGAMMAESLLRAGHPGVAAEYLRWYAPYQFDTGKVPCCVDERGADPVPEHDSPGELIFLAAEVFRYTNDRRLLEDMWPHVEAAARYLDGLRRSERTDANLKPETRAFYGLLPASISHEGYSAKPMHSYWDDFWGLKGYAGAIAMARALDRPEAARRLEAQLDEFRTDLAASLRHAVAAHAIAYLPGAAELGDFDPTSTTIAISPAGELHRLPRDLVVATYERYWREFVERRDGRRAWEDYTPYEIRTVGTFVRLGWRDRAHQLLDFFLAGRRPPAWNQWPEVIGREARQPRFIGDLPHGWVASDFMRAALDLFAYERDGDQALVLAAGVPPAWLRDGGVEVKAMPTPYGSLSYSLRRVGDTVVLQLGGSARVPPGGFVLAWPGSEGATGQARVNGRPAHWQGNELRFDELPARVVIGGRS